MKSLLSLLAKRSKEIDRFHFAHPINFKLNLIIRLILIGLIFSSCNQVQMMKSKIRQILFGVSTHSISDADHNQEVQQQYLPETEEQNTIKSPKKKIRPSSIKKNNEITKILALCQEFINSPDQQMKLLLIEEIQASSEQLQKEETILNEDLISCLYKFLPLIENKKEEAIDVLFYFYQSLKGPNLEEATKIFATTLDFYPSYLIEQYAFQLEKRNCSLARSVLTNIDPEKRVSILQHRKEQIEFVSHNYHSQLIHKSFSQLCIRSIEVELQK